MLFTGECLTLGFFECVVQNGTFFEKAGNYTVPFMAIKSAFTLKES